VKVDKLFDTYKPVLPGKEIEVRGTITDEATDSTTLAIEVARGDEIVASESALVSR
jgi:hypothetical protein